MATKAELPKKFDPGSNASNSASVMDPGETSLVLDRMPDDKPGPAATSAPPEPAPAEADDSAPPASRPMKFLVLLAVIYTLYLARAVLLPLALAIVLSLLLRPIVRWMSRRRIPESVGASLCLLVLAGTAVFGVMQLVGPARQWVNDMPRLMEVAKTKLASVKSQLHQLSRAKDKIEEIAGGNEPGRPQEVLIQQPSLASNAGLVSATGEYMATAGLIVVLSFFLLTSGDQLINNILTTLPTFRDKRHFVELIQNVQKGVSSYLFTVTVINIGLGVATSIALWLLGMPNPALWGVLATVTNFVPFVGPALCGAVIGFASLLTFDSLAYAALAPTLFYVIAALEGNIITPALMGRRMSLSPILVIVYLTFWGWMWGIGGAVLAVPLLAATKIYCDQFEKTQPLGTMLSG